LQQTARWARRNNTRRRTCSAFGETARIQHSRAILSGRNIWVVGSRNSCVSSLVCTADYNFIWLSYSLHAKQEFDGYRSLCKTVDWNNGPRRKPHTLRSILYHASGGSRCYRRQN
jgi:hypothetical protein